MSVIIGIDIRPFQYVIISSDILLNAPAPSIERA